MKLIPQNRQLDLSVIDHIKYENSRNGVSEATRQNLRVIGQQYNDYLIRTRKRINAESIISFLDDLKYQQASLTWNLSRQNLKKLLKHQPGIRDKYLGRIMVDEIFAEIKPVKQDKKVLKYLTPDQVEQLIEQSSPGLGLIFEFLFKTGCRVSELTSIRLRDITLADQVEIQLVGKGNKQRTVFIDHRLYEAIRSEFSANYYLFENRNHHQLDRSNLYRKIKNAGVEILGQEIHPHLLRHSTANYLLKTCHKSAKFVSEYLGHASPSTLMEMYIHEQPDSKVVSLFSK
jgi:integrase